MEHTTQDLSGCLTCVFLGCLIKFSHPLEKVLSCTIKYFLLRKKILFLVQDKTLSRCQKKNTPSDLADRGGAIIMMVHHIPLCTRRIYHALPDRNCRRS